MSAHLYMQDLPEYEEEMEKDVCDYCLFERPIDKLKVVSINGHGGEATICNECLNNSRKCIVCKEFTKNKVRSTYRQVCEILFPICNDCLICAPRGVQQ